jgi:hypothetical protein
VGITITNNGAVSCAVKTMNLKFSSGGLFTGSFLDNGTGHETSYYGAALQNKTNAYGFFLTPDQSGSFTLIPGP